MSIVVIGAGLAGANPVEELRALGYDADLTLIVTEQQLPCATRPCRCHDRKADRVGTSS